MPEKRIGLIGAGWVTDFHLPAWRELAGRARVIAICDPDTAKAKQRADAFDIPEVFGSAPEMIAATGLDIIDIASPRETHPQYCRLAADAGLAILCQKPLAPTLAEAETLAAEIGSRVPFMVNENWRFRPWYRLAREWIGALGPIRHVRLDFLSSGMIPDANGLRPALVRQPMFATLRRLLVMEVLIHHLDTLRFLIGEMSLETARLARTTADIVGEDIATLELESRIHSGARFHIQGNLAVHGAPPAPRDRLCAVGRDGTITFDGETLKLAGPHPSEHTFEAEAGYRDSYRAAMAHFLDCLDDESPFETRPDDNLATLRLVEDAYRVSGFESGKR